jgi:hypothetical protein
VASAAAGISGAVASTVTTALLTSRPVHAGAAPRSRADGGIQDGGIVAAESNPGAADSPYGPVHHGPFGKIKILKSFPNEQWFDSPRRNDADGGYSSGVAESNPV